MKNLSRFICALFLVLFTGSVVAQNVLDDVNIDENTPSRRVIPYAFLRQADVMWKKRVWRIIDLREKINFPLYYPLQPNQNRKSVWDALRDALKNGELRAYSFNIADVDNSFQIPLTKTEIQKNIEPVDSGMTDENGNPIPPVPDPVTSQKIRGYFMKEDWFFDKQRSVMDVRILGICPMLVPYTNQHEDTTQGLQEMFWIYYPEARHLFAVTESFNVNNDAERRTLEDIFWKRQFSSYIFQESNVYNRHVLEYENGIAVQLESEKIKKKMFDFEHDMWNY